MTRTFLATVLLFSMSIVLHAQSPALTNADVANLVAIGVSDQTVTAAIHEAKVTHFDLSATAISDLAVKGVSPAAVAVMRESSTPQVSANTIGAPVQSPTSHPRTIAEASAEALKVKHEWAPSPNTSTPSPSPTASAPSVPPSVPRATDEWYWKNRWTPLAEKRNKDRLDSLLFVTPEYRMRWAVIVRLDDLAIASLQEEARVAGVSPGDIFHWLPN